MPNYIMDLRKLVGHRTLMQCAASIIIVNEKNLAEFPEPLTINGCIEKFLKVNKRIDLLQMR